MNRKWRAALIAIMAITFVAALGWGAAYRFHVHIIDKMLDQSISMIAPAMANRVGGFGTLADLLHKDPDVEASLAPDADRMALNAELERLALGSGAEHIFVLDYTGDIIASSYWAEVDEFPEVNLSFRPYFQQAMKTGQGEFNALGLSTGKPGYFLAHRVESPTGEVGAIVVQFTLLPGEMSYWASNTTLALADGNGIVFLTSHPSWRYRPLHELSPETIADITQTRQYQNVDLTTQQPLFTTGEDGKRRFTDDDDFIYRVRTIDPFGWTLIVAQPYSAPQTAANIIALILALCGFVVSGVVLIYLQHRQLARIRKEQSALLEIQVKERTRELAEEVEIRRRTEQNLRDAEQDLVQATKLAALGQMSAAIAHEVSQPLTALAATLTAAERRFDGGELDNGLALVTRAQSLTRRIQHIIRHLRSFSKKERGECDRMVLASSIHAALELAETRAREIGAGIEVRDLDRSVEIMGNPVRLEQVLINLLLNALDAVADREERAVGIGMKTDGKTATISVWDTGPGIPEELAERLAEPFFTTKSDGDGIGLGLSISQSILADFGGSMRFVPREGGGTVCEVSLPQAEASEKSEAAE